MNQNVKPLDADKNIGKSEYQLILPCVVKSDKVNQRSGVKNDRQWTIRTQEIWVHLPGEPYPQKVLKTLEGGEILPIGNYDLVLDNAIVIGRFNSLELNDRQLQLIPTK